MPEKRFYRPDEVAALLEEPLRNVYRWIREGKIRAERIGKRLKIHRDEFERLGRLGAG
jgi:excisionase family DNA binding protein